MTSKSVVLGLLALALAGCKTEIVFENQIPGASVDNVRWESGSTSFSSESGDRLEPGQSSEAVSISGPHEGETGRIHFELIVEGRKVALVTEDRFTAHTNETTTFTLTPETVATNPLADSPSEGTPSPADP